MIIAVQNSHRNTMYDLKVRMMVRSIVSRIESLDEFEQNFNDEIRLIPNMSAYSPYTSYRLARISPIIKVWHRNTNGKNDRLLFTIIYTNASFIII